MAMDKKTQFNVWYIVIAFAGMLLLQYFLGVYQQQVETIDYSQFQSYLKDGKVDEITVSENYIRGRIKDPAPGQAGEFITHRVDPNVADDLSKYGVSYKGTTESTLLRDLLSWIVPMLVFFGIWMFVFRRIAEKQGLGGGFMSIGKSKAKVYVEHDTKVTFADVAGVDEAKAELQEIVDFLKDPKRYSRLGGRAAQGHSPGRAAGHGQDPAGAGRRRRGWRAVLLHLRLGIRRDVRRRRRRPGARPLRAGARQGAGHHLHRRAGCAGPRPRRLCLGRRP